MKAVPFIPLAYIAGAHGFALFAPYAALVLVIVMISRHGKRAPSTNFKQISTN